MNLFGAFGFGSLIKTFLPGLILFIILLLYLELSVYYLHNYIGIFNFMFTNPVLFTLVSIPVSIILGVILNSIVFSGFSEAILEKKHKKDNKPFYDFRERIFNKINEKISHKFQLSEPDRKTFMDVIDPRYLLLHKRSLDNIMYLRESYWYYMEFQLNTLIAVLFGTPAFITTLCILKNHDVIKSSALYFSIISLVAGCFFLTCFLMKSAKDNLDAHRKKELSLLLGSAFFELNKNQPDDSI